MINDALETQMQHTPKTIDLLSPKIEDTDNLAILKGGVGDESGIGMDIDSHPSDVFNDGEISQVPQNEIGLSHGSNNPVLGDQNQLESGRIKDEAQVNGSLLADRSSKFIEQLRFLREPISNLSETVVFIDLDLQAFRDALNLSESDPPHEPDLTLIFPDLQPYNLLDVSVLDTLESKRKTDKKTDKDDPFKRVEETTYNKLYPANKFMHTKPTLISALQPSRKWHDGAWYSLDESPVIADLDSFPSLPGEDSMSCESFLLYIHVSLLNFVNSII